MQSTMLPYCLLCYHIIDIVTKLIQTNITVWQIRAKVNYTQIEEDLCAHKPA